MTDRLPKDRRPQPGPAVPAVACRTGCAACCIAPSISSPIPGMPAGKPAGVACVQLAPDLSCRLFGTPARPAVCASLSPDPEMCGGDRGQALAVLTELERLTAPSGPPRRAGCWGSHKVW